MSEYIKTFSRYQKHQVSSSREILKKIYLDTLSPGKIRESKLPETSLLFIVFHNLFNDQIDHFRELLLEIQNHYTFISYSEACDKLLIGDIDKRYACISADDGFKNFIDASSLFDELNIPGMVFINSHIIGEKNLDLVTQHCKERLHSPPIEFMDWNEIEDLLKRGHEIGNHGWKHKKLTELTKAELEEEVYKGKEEIENKIGTIDHYAYAYGIAECINNLAIQIILESGHSTVGSALRGQHITTQSKSKLIRRELIEASYSLKHMRYFVEHDKN